MSHSWANSLAGQWLNLAVPQVSDFAAIDSNSVGLINGDGGGTWAPAGNIDVAGAGMWFCGPSLLQAGAVCETVVGGYIHLGDSDYPQLVDGHSGALRTIQTPCASAVSCYGFVLTETPLYLSAEFVGARAVLPLRVHQGATLSTATLTFIVGAHATVPTQLPRFRVCCRDSAGNVVPVSAGDHLGYVSPSTPASGSAWHAAGAVQALVATCAVGTVIDRGANTYFAEIVDESGTGSVAGNIYINVAMNFTGIADNRPA